MTQPTTPAVVALLDHHLLRSMGAVPFVARVAQDGDEVLRTFGFASEAMLREVAEDELDRLLAFCTARPVHKPWPGDAALPAVLDGHVALWVGHDFRKEARALGLSLPLEDGDALVRVDDGTAHIVPAADCFERLTAWVERAWTRVYAEREPRIAHLMSWTLPDAPLSRRARLLTATPEERTRLTDWYARLDRSAGRPPWDAPSP